MTRLIAALLRSVARAMAHHAADVHAILSAEESPARGAMIGALEAVD